MKMLRFLLLSLVVGSIGFAAEGELRRNYDGLPLSPMDIFIEKTTFGISSVSTSKGGKNPEFQETVSNNNKQGTLHFSRLADDQHLANFVLKYVDGRVMVDQSNSSSTAPSRKVEVDNELELNYFVDAGIARNVFAKPIWGDTEWVAVDVDGDGIFTLGQRYSDLVANINSAKVSFTLGMDIIVWDFDSANADSTPETLGEDLRVNPGQTNSLVGMYTVRVERIPFNQIPDRIYSAHDMFRSRFEKPLDGNFLVPVPGVRKFLPVAVIKLEKVYQQNKDFDDRVARARGYELGEEVALVVDRRSLEDKGRSGEFSQVYRIPQSLLRVTDPQKYAQIQASMADYSSQAVQNWLSLWAISDFAPLPVGSDIGERAESIISEAKSCNFLLKDANRPPLTLGGRQKPDQQRG